MAPQTLPDTVRTTVVSPMVSVTMSESPPSCAESAPQAQRTAVAPRVSSLFADIALHISRR